MNRPQPHRPPGLHAVPLAAAAVRALVVPLGRLLVEDGAITQGQLVRALQLQMRLGARLGEILVAEGWTTEDRILSALARQTGLARADLRRQPCDPRLCRFMPHRFWMHHRVLPWRKLGPALLVATSDPAEFGALRRHLSHLSPHVVPVLASEKDIAEATARVFRDTLAAAANTRLDPQYSCRTWTARKRIPIAAAVAAAGLAMLSAPGTALAALFAAAFTTLALFATLRLLGAGAHLLSHGYLNAPAPARPIRHRTGRLPRVSVLVPLYREREIAGALIRRLQRLSYPKALLDVILVLEERDDVTREALDRAELPHWIRVIEVPEHGGLTTKPRAMNYALDFCRGEIVGVWDAEDAPVPAQIEQVVDHFETAPPDVVCLQGILDFYNPRSNWRSRCFTIEYASWFRIVLPGIARMRLVVPLGGTTLFFRRDKLEELGGWDAHNVTEDADLGVRLARAGYRTELIDTVTFEEANHRAWPWVRQRSRWLKGFMVTYLVHMRSPRRLWADLGGWRFAGFQAFFLGTLGQFLLAPLLWSFWPMAFGWAHPAQGVVPGAVLSGLFALLLASELLALCVGLAAVSASGRRFLVGWVPTMVLYYPLGVVAAYKALIELCLHPFFWDKTQHGQAAEETLPR